MMGNSPAGGKAITHARIDPSRLRTSVKPSFKSPSAYFPLLTPAVLQQGIIHQTVLLLLYGIATFK